jgi:hypothetical protein
VAETPARPIASPRTDRSRQIPALGVFVSDANKRTRCLVFRDGVHRPGRTPCCNAGGIGGLLHDRVDCARGTHPDSGLCDETVSWRPVSRVRHHSEHRCVAGRESLQGNRIQCSRSVRHDVLFFSTGACRHSSGGSGTRSIDSTFGTPQRSNASRADAGRVVQTNIYMNEERNEWHK